MPKCPVCKEKCSSNDTICSNCGFPNPNIEFVNHADAEEWKKRTLEPCQTVWKHIKRRCDELEQKYAAKRTQPGVQSLLEATENKTSNQEMAPNKIDEWLTEGNISYKSSYACAYTNQGMCEVSKLSFDFSENKEIVVSFSVKKTYDYKGDKEYGIIAFSWKLKDEHGLLIEDGYWMHHGLMRVGTVGFGSISIRTLNLKSSVKKYVLELTDLPSTNSRTFINRRTKENI